MNQTNPSESSILIPGAAYIRYSSEMQSESFSLDAQLRQIKEQAERDKVEIVKVYADPAVSAYRKKFRPGINAMREAARRGEFKVLYVHKVDRLARRLEWSLEIVHELQSLEINFKAVQQPFDLRTPEGKLLFHMISSLGEFYSELALQRNEQGQAGTFAARLSQRRRALGLHQPAGRNSQSGGARSEESRGGGRNV